VIRVLVAASSALCRARAIALLANRPGLEVVETARGTADALLKVEALGPDVLLVESGLLDEGPAGLLRKLRVRAPLPVILLVSSDGDARVLPGLEDGAADFVVLPPSGDRPARAEAAKLLVGLIHEVHARADHALQVPGPIPHAVEAPREAEAAGPRLVVVGASTGGPRAVQTLLEALPAGTDAALLVALHMPGVFTRLYAERLDRICSMRVAEAAEGERLMAGTVRIVPGGTQASLSRRGDRLHVHLRPRAPQEVHAPSVDLVMESAAAAAGSAAIGVILTGMGEDGSTGLNAIRGAGGFTVAESETTALIFGMPGGAIRAGAAAAVAPLEEIPALVLGRCGVMAAGGGSASRAPGDPDR